MSLSPTYDPHPPAHTESSPPSDFNFIVLQKIEYSDVFRCRSGHRQRTEFLKTDSESLFLDGSGHIFSFLSSTILSWENPSRKRRYRSERFCRARNRFLPQQNLFDRYRRFLEGSLFMTHTVLNIIKEEAGGRTSNKKSMGWKWLLCSIRLQNQLVCEYRIWTSAYGEDESAPVKTLNYALLDPQES
jgi:hypothetical protein